ncbi:MAG: hypothetical protein ACTHOE_16225 [Conexibacter sp.]
MSHRRHVLVLLALALVALVAMPAAGLAARRRSKVPPAGTTLTSADQRLRLTVVAGRLRNGKPAKFVDVEWDLTVTCSTGPALAHLRARARVRGNAFASTVNTAGVKQKIAGRFANVHKATGQGQLSFPTPSRDTCSSGTVKFTAQG